MIYVTIQQQTYAPPPCARRCPGIRDLAMDARDKVIPSMGLQLLEKRGLESVVLSKRSKHVAVLCAKYSPLIESG